MIDKLWAPVPWMLEAAIVLQLALHKFTEAAVITGLLLFNAAIGFFQEGRAQATTHVSEGRTFSASAQIATQPVEFIYGCCQPSLSDGCCAAALIRSRTNT